MTNTNSSLYRKPGSLIPCLMLKTTLNNLVLQFMKLSIHLAIITLVKQMEWNFRWKNLENANEMREVPLYLFFLLGPKIYS